MQDRFYPRMLRHATWAVMLAVCLFFLTPPVIGAAEELQFTILHTNDEHAALWPRPTADYRFGATDPTVGGFARLAGVLERERRERGDRPVLTVNAGDFFSGSPFSWLGLREHAPELALLAAMKYDVVALGNHEWDYGPEFLADYLAAAGAGQSDFPVVLASNAEIPPELPLHDRGIRPTYVAEIGREYGWEEPLRVGFFSLLGDDAAAVAPAAAPVTFSDPMEAADRAVHALQTEGAEVIIALTHSGLLEDRLLAATVSDIDIIVGGHCHTALHTPVIENGTVIVQAGSRTEYVGCIELTYERGQGILRVDNRLLEQPHLISVTGEDPEHPEIRARVTEYGRILGRLLDELTDGVYDDPFAIVARLDQELLAHPSTEEHAMGNLVTDAFRWSAEQHLGQTVDVAFQASGQIRGGLQPATLPASAGLISVYDVLEQVGLGLGPDGDPGAPLVVMRFSGAELLRILEISQLLNEIMGSSFFLHVSGIRAEYDASRAILGWVPVLDVPVPTYRAVSRAEVIRHDGSTHTLTRDDDTLFTVVGDHYVVSFLPMVGDMLPRLNVIPKDLEGEPIRDLDAAVVQDDGGQELKGWRAVLDYVNAQSHPGQALPTVDFADYAPGNRLIARPGIPIAVVPAAGVLVMFGTLVWYRRRKRMRRSHEGRESK